MRIVVKVGTSTLTHPSGQMNIRRMEKLCEVLSDIKNAGHQLLLVSSGAIAMGVGRMGLKARPTEMAAKQAVAAVGQNELMYIYDKYFNEYNHVTAQILLTGDDLRDPQRRAHFENTAFKLLEMNVLPIINENDTVATDEIGIGDNDTLAAIVAATVQADLVVLFSDIDGLYTASPKQDAHAEMIPEVCGITPEIRAMAGGSGTERGTGGMVTKLNAAEIANAAGIDLIITNGNHPEALYDIVEGRSVGTRFRAPKAAGRQNP